MAEFKDTEIGRIPKEWEVAKIDQISIDLLSGGTPSTFNSDYWNGKIPWMTSAHITGRIVTTGQRYITEEGLKNSASNLIPKDNLLVATRVGIGKAVINKVDMAISQDLTGIIINKDKASTEFFYWIIISYGKKLKSLAQGSTIKGILREGLEKLSIPLPPLTEQQKIAGVLEAVDEAIQKAEEKIKKTERLKQGLMQKLLTRGIGHKEFKDSEIGRIPKEWEIASIKEVAKVKGGKRLPKGHSLLDSPSSHPYIRVVDFKNMSVDRENLKYLSLDTYAYIKEYTISSKDVYISIAGTTGLAGTIPPDLDGANLTENAAKLCNLQNVDKLFLAYILNSEISKPQINSLIGKATQPKLALFRIEKIKIPLPLLSEQHKIVEILSTVDKKLQLERKRKENLERIKKVLMNDLLTGKKRIKL